MLYSVDISHHRKNEVKRTVLKLVFRNAIIGLYIFAFWVLLPSLLVKLSHSIDKNRMKRSFPLHIKLLGVLVSAVSAMMLFMAVKDFFRQTGKLPISAIAPYNKLAKKGLYAIWRHPVYLFYILLMAGIGLFTGSVGLLLVILPLFSIITFIHARIEEMWLLRKHGDIYREYLKKTSLILPKKLKASPK